MGSYSYSLPWLLLFFVTFVSLSNTLGALLSALPFILADFFDFELFLFLILQLDFERDLHFFFLGWVFSTSGLLLSIATLLEIMLLQLCSVLVNKLKIYEDFFFCNYIPYYKIYQHLQVYLNPFIGTIDKYIIEINKALKLLRDLFIFYSSVESSVICIAKIDHKIFKSIIISKNKLDISSIRDLSWKATRWKVFWALFEINMQMIWN